MRDKQKLRSYPDLGEVRFIKKRRSKNINIRVYSDHISVSLPFRLTFSKAEKVLLENREKIGAKHREFRKLAEDRPEISEDTWQQAEVRITDRCNEFCESYGFKRGRIRIKNMSSRWGSCSHKNDLSFNVMLIFLPPNLFDYIILHELCHTLHPHHGPDFWQELNRFTPGNARSLQKDLRCYNYFLL